MNGSVTSRPFNYVKSIAREQVLRETHGSGTSRPLNCDRRTNYPAKLATKKAR